MTLTKAKRQKGSIQVSLVILMVGLATASIILYRRGELFSLLADISQVFSPEIKTEEELILDPSGEALSGLEDGKVILEEEGEGEGVYIEGILDGDTIILKTGEKVDYIGVDAPETVDSSRPVECFGRQAAYENKNLVAGKRVRMEEGAVGKTQEGNLLRYVWINDIFINDYLIREGFARFDPESRNDKFSYQLSEAEQKAKEENKGLWRMCDISFSEVASGVPVSQDTFSESGGCTDPAALNFNRKATFNDGSCRYPYRPVQQTGSEQDLLPPKIENVAVTGVGTNSAVIGWETDEPATSRIQYGKSLDFSSITPFEPELSFSHSIQLEGLDMGSTYYYRIISADAHNNWPIFISRAFTTLHVNGELSVETMSLDLEEPVMMMGETGKKLGMWRFNANDLEDLTISQVIAYNKNPAGSGNAINLSMWCGGNPMVSLAGTLVSNSVTFLGNEGKCVVPKGGSLVFTLYGDIATQEQGGLSGEAVQFFLELPEEITGNTPDSIIAESSFGYAQALGPGEKIANPIYSYQTRLNIGTDCYGKCAVRERKSRDEVILLTISSENGKGALVEAVTFNVSGDLVPSPGQVPFYLENSKKERLAQGFLDKATGKLHIDFPTPLEVGESDENFVLVVDTLSLMVPDKTYVAESLKVSADLGSPEEKGGFKWNDGASLKPIFWVYSPEPVSVSLGY